MQRWASQTQRCNAHCRASKTLPSPLFRVTRVPAAPRCLLAQNSLVVYIIPAVIFVLLVVLFALRQRGMYLGVGSRTRRKEVAQAMAMPADALASRVPRGGVMMNQMTTTTTTTTSTTTTFAPAVPFEQQEGEALPMAQPVVAQAV